MLKIFITAQGLVKIVSSEVNKPNRNCSSFYRILKSKKYSRIYVGSIDNKIKSIIDTFKQMHDFIIDESMAGYVDSIATCPMKVIENPNALFVLNISKDEASDISSIYGVLCFSADAIEENKLIDPNIEYSPNTNDIIGGWPAILPQVKCLPSNALIIVDRYLFANDTPNFSNGLNNVFDILKTLLPERPKKEEKVCNSNDNNFNYHVCIVYSPDAGKNKKRLAFGEIANRINKRKKELARNYHIDIEIVGIPSNSRFYDYTHNRRIVSNYYIIRAEHQISAFFNNKSSCPQTLTPQFLFTYYSLRNHSDPPLKSIEQTADTINSLSRILASEIKQNICYYALNGIVITPEKCVKMRGLKIINRRVNG